MAVTKIHPIKTTLKKSIDYICKGNKTDDEIYVTTHLCSRENAHKEFELTKKQFQSKTKTLAHHLIQSFVPGEVSFEEAHQVGIELCERVLENKYEYVLATHIDKGHVHNHIIFNSVDVDEGKVYQSYYGSYMRIRNYSDEICREHNLSVIDQETQKEINEIKKRKFVNWYDWNQDQKGKSFKSRLQFDIDRIIKESRNWEEFLEKMRGLGYEIKHGKYIAFKGVNQQRFTRAKTIGENYTEESIKLRIQNKQKEIGQIVDVKAKDSKGYAYWARKHNLKTASDIVIVLRDLGFHSMSELEGELSKLSYQMNDMRKEFENKNFEQKRIKEVAKDLQVCLNKKAHYDGYLKNPKDKIYLMMNKKDIEDYQISYEQVEIFLKQFPEYHKIVKQGLAKNDGKAIFKALNSKSKRLHQEQEKLAQDHNNSQREYKKLENLKINMDKFMKQDDKKKQSIKEEIQTYKRDKQERSVPNSRKKDWERS